MSNISDITLVILHFTHQNTLNELPLESTSFDEIIKYTSRQFILAQKKANLEFVNLSVLQTYNPFGCP